MPPFIERSVWLAAVLNLLLIATSLGCASNQDNRPWTGKANGVTTAGTGGAGNSPGMGGASAGSKASAGTTGAAGNASGQGARGGSGAGGADGGTSGNAGTSGSAAGTSGAAGDAGSAAGAGSGGSVNPDAGSDPMTGMDSGSGPIDPDAPSVGSGDMSQPAVGPAPTRAGDVGAPFVLVKNWDFGTSGTINDLAALIAEFQFHDQFGTIANGTNYGSVTVAPTTATAVAANNLGLSGNMQPVEQAGRPYREFTADSLKAYVRPLSATATNVSVSAHDTGNGSFMAKWKLPKGGSLLGKDLLWETRARMPKPAKAYWYAIWTAGSKWNKGAEMDVLESFGTPNIYPPAAAYHVNSVGGSDNTNYDSWPSALTKVGVPMADRDLTAWHVWTWVYLKNDTFKVYMDGYVVQTGSIHWTLAGTQTGEALDLQFLYDFGWGHTQIADVNIGLPASDFPIEYEIDYSRVYLR